jgi:hypothetical protein
MSNQRRNEEIKALHAAGWTQRDIADKYGLNPGHVSRIVRQAGPLDDPQEASKMLQLQDKARYARGRLREGLRNEDVIRHCAEIAARETKPFRPVKAPNYTRSRDKVTETLCVVNSDGHHDQVVRPEEVNGLENYNFLVSLRRAEVFVDGIIRYATQTLSNYQFPRLVIFHLGDSTSGEIHDAERRSAFGNQFKNCLAIGGLKAACYRDLAPYFSEIDVICTSGNHGRRTSRKEYAGGAHNNWDYMVNKVCEQRLSDQSNIRFHIPNSWDTVVDIEGFAFHASHGDDVASSGGHPWVGLTNLHKTNSGIHKGSGPNKPFRNAREIDYYVIGHHHTIGCVDGNGVGYICNGAWVGTDAYAYQSLRVAGRPQQMMFGVHKDHGKTWNLPLHLDGRDNAKTCRYDSVLDCVDGLDYCLNAPRTTGEWT